MYLKEYESLLCRYFDPTKELIDEEYHLVAKYLLRAYLKQVKVMWDGGEHNRYVEPTVEVTLSEVISWYYNNCLYKLEKELEKWEKRKALKELLLSLNRQNILELLKDIPAIMSADTVTIEGILEELMHGTSLDIIKIKIYSSILKLIAYTVYYVLSLSIKRRLNGALQRTAQILERECKVRGYNKLRQALKRPGEVFNIIVEYLKRSEVQKYISNEPMITERYVYELALKLKEIRTQLYGHR